MNQILPFVATTQTSLENISHLSFSNMHLEKLPVDLCKYKNLQSLDLSGNDFKQLPAAVFKLKRLRRINLSNNGKLNWSRTFDQLARLPKLQILDLASNNLQSLPKEIESLERLKQLTVDDNPLDVLSEQNLFHLPKTLSTISAKNCLYNQVGLRLLKLPALKNFYLTCYDYQYLNRLAILQSGADVVVQ